MGTLIPNATFYISVERLPAGIMSILISTIPLMAFPDGTGASEWNGSRPSAWWA